MKLDERSLDLLLPMDHPARTVWAYVAGLDLSAFLAQIKAVAGRPGQSTIDPRILLTLWMLATTEGIGSARALDRMTKFHIGYEWVCGDVSVNYHTLADFRSQNEELLNGLLTETVATLMQQGLVELEEVAQDGMRVRASAGASSFRRKKSLDECLAKAKKQVEILKKQVDEDDGAVSRRQQAAQVRGAREKQERIEEALRQREQLVQRQEQIKKERGSTKRPNEPRVSTTDPDARKMKMPDGGFRSAFNVEFATDTASGIIVGVDVVNVGSDSGQLLPMIEQLEERYEQTPDRVLADGDFANLGDIETLHAEHDVDVYSPVKNAAKLEAEGVDPYKAKAKDKPGVGEWRERMGTPEAKAIYKRRAQTAEWVNARARNMGLHQFRVRGLKKVLAVALMHALTSNFVQTIRLKMLAATAAAA